MVDLAGKFEMVWTELMNTTGATRSELWCTEGMVVGRSRGNTRRERRFRRKIGEQNDDKALPSPKSTYNSKQYSETMTVLSPRDIRARLDSSSRCDLPCF